MDPLVVVDVVLREVVAAVAEVCIGFDSCDSRIAALFGICVSGLDLDVSGVLLSYR